MLEFKGWNKEREEMEVSITSMIDVIFILLIFFMISTQFKKNSLPLDLPQSQNKSQQDTVLMLSVNQEKLELDGKIISLEELKPQLEAHYQRNPELTLSLECHKETQFQRVVDVLGHIQGAGISKIGIVHETMD